jgi:hypothetical protein
LKLIAGSNKLKSTRIALPTVYLLFPYSVVIQPDYPVVHLDPYQNPKVKIKVKKRKDRELVGAIQIIKE